MLRALRAGHFPSIPFKGMARGVHAHLARHAQALVAFCAVRQDHGVVAAAQVLYTHVTTQRHIPEKAAAPVAGQLSEVMHHFLQSTGLTPFQLLPVKASPLCRITRSTAQEMV